MGDRNLSEFQCHFTWDFMNLAKRTKLYLRDHINKIERELSSQNSEGSKQKKRNFPQLYSLRGFLYVQLCQKTDEGGQELLEKAEISLMKALEECTEDNDGYRAVIYADLIHLKQKWKHENADEEIKKYSVSENKENHPEVLAMKGYAASFFHCYEDAIKFYKEALEKQKTSEWVFGLALVMQRPRVRLNNSHQRQEIEKLLKEALRLDPSYDMAKLKLAQELWEDKATRDENKQDIDDLIDQVLKKPDNPPTVLVTATTLLCEVDNRKGENALKEALAKYPNSHKISRALGTMYFERWRKNKKNESELKLAIEYYTKGIDSESANMMASFDITTIGYFHTIAFWYYKNNGILKKAEEHRQEYKSWNEKAEGIRFKKLHPNFAQNFTLL